MLARLLLIALLPACISSHEVPDAALPAQIRWASAGGEAWTFRKQVTGWARGCERVEIETARGQVQAGLEPGNPQRFRATVTLDPGDNRLTAHCHPRRGPPAAATIDWHVPMDDRPRARIRLEAREEGLVLDAGDSQTGQSQAAPIVQWRWRVHGEQMDGERMHGEWAQGETATMGDEVELQGQQRVLPTPPDSGRYLVRLEVTDALGRKDRSLAQFSVADGNVEIRDTASVPEWLDEAVVYGVAPFLLGPQGLDRLRGRLEEICALGADTLWLSPIYLSPEGDYGYAVLDPMQVTEALGGQRALRALVRDAHARGMRVLLDFVPNHTSDAHPYFQHAEQHGARSPYFGYYQRDAAGRAIHYFDWNNLPNLDYDHPEVRRWMLEALSYWVRELGVDGFRIDVAWGVHERAPDFFARVRQELRRINPDVVLIAEATAREAAYFRGGFDAAYDWTESPGQWAWAEAFAGDGVIDLRALRRALIADGEGSPPGARTLRFLNNNDTGARFFTRHGVGRYRVALAMMLSLPGIPSLFVGDESLEVYEPYQRLEPLHLEADPAVREWIGRWTALRAQHSTLREGTVELVEVSSDAPVLAYLRHLEGQPPLLVVLNFDAQEQRVELRLPAAWQRHFQSGCLRELVSEATSSIIWSQPTQSALRLQLPAHAAWLLELGSCAHPEQTQGPQSG